MTPIQSFLVESRFLLKADVADLLGWNEDTLDAKMARREAPPFIRVKRLALFPWADLREWIDQEGIRIDPDKGKRAANSDLVGGAK